MKLTITLLISMIIGVNTYAQCDTSIMKLYTDDNIMLIGFNFNTYIHDDIGVGMYLEYNYTDDIFDYYIPIVFNEDVGCITTLSNVIIEFENKEQFSIAHSGSTPKCYDDKSLMVIFHIYLNNDILNNIVNDVGIKSISICNDRCYTYNIKKEYRYVISTISKCLIINN